ncbi:MAG TPA: aminodeoxychorismate/anthranilate synthase component II [Bacteroidales bacterium]|nr:aminodeoxychorismate/anthranilate synthase component II [Bacteroidales bacterium]
MKIAVLDNYDSFTYNLVHYIEKITNQKVDVFRNDQISVSDLNEYDKILLSPGPGLPNEAGILIDVIKTYAPTKSILGVCLGMQAMAEAFGGKLNNLDKVYHGIATQMTITNPDVVLYKGIEPQFIAGRYHSWVVDVESLPKEFIISSKDEEGNAMSIFHKSYDMRAVQFHPESVLTPQGFKMIENWVNQ